MGIIPSGTLNFSITIDDRMRNDTIQIFTRDGKHLVGTTLDKWSDPIWDNISVNTNDFINEANGFLPSAIYDDSLLNGGYGNINVDYDNPNPILTQFDIGEMHIGYTGDGGDRYMPFSRVDIESMTIDVVTEDLIFIINGHQSLDLNANWTYMPNAVTPPGPGPGPDQPNPPNPPDPGTTQTPQGDLISIKTQDEAQQALTRIDDAIVAKDKARAHLGAMQNRLENSSTNITTQAENLQAAEARISNADVAREMTLFVRNQILTQSAVAMLGQANSYPHMLSGLITG